MDSNNYETSKYYLEEQYKIRGDMKADFRNINLNNLIKNKIRGHSILDIGCVNAFLLNRLDCDQKKVCGIEPNDRLITLANKFYPKIKIYNGFAENIDKLIFNKFDTITIIDVLEHIKNDNLMINKIHDHLNASGRIIITVPAFQFLFGKRDKSHGHYRRYNKKLLIQKLLSSNFRIIQIRYWNFLGIFPYLFSEKILRKELNTELRTNKKKGWFKKMIQKSLNLWFKYIENNINFGFGLSIIVIAEKINKN